MPSYASEEFALLRTLIDPVALFESVVRDDVTHELARSHLWQKDALRSTSKRQMYLTSRQAGKSSTAATKALHKALTHEGATILDLAGVDAKPGDLPQVPHLLPGVG